MSLGLKLIHSIQRTQCMKLSAKPDSQREPIPRLRCRWIETGDAVRPLGCKWLSEESTTSTELRVKRSDAMRLKGGPNMARYSTSRPMIVDAVQCTSTRTIATDLGFISVKRGEWVVCGESGESMSLKMHSSVAHSSRSTRRRHFLLRLNQTILT
jgi:hypothetical protein